MLIPPAARTEAAPVVLVSVGPGGEPDVETLVVLFPPVMVGAGAAVDDGPLGGAVGDGALVSIVTPNSRQRL